MQVQDYELARMVAEAIEIIAIAVIAISVLAAMVGAGIKRARDSWDAAFAVFKTYMARGLLVGLDLLIAADIIKSVTLDPTLENIVGLGLLILIRTFLSWALILEATGRWPWQKDPASSVDRAQEY
jgi:uncharacterized membrane protein